MTRKEAKERLLYHSSDKGFLGMLRPFEGVLIKGHYLEIMAAIQVLAEDLEKPLIDREIIASLWAICHLGRDWAVHPEGMLRRNNLISEKQVQEIDSWLDDISYKTFSLLDGTDREGAFDNE